MTLVGDKQHRCFDILVKYMKSENGCQYYRLEAV